MRSIFITEDGSKIKDVFSGSVLNRLEKNNIERDKIFSIKDIETNDFSDVEFIFSTWYMPTLTKKEIKEKFPSLKAVFYAAGTVKYFARPFLELGISVYSADRANAVAVSEFAYAQILLANKGYYQSQYYYKRMFYNKARRIAMLHKGNYESTIGIIGAGKIGLNVIKMLKEHNFRILVSDIYLNKDYAKNMGVELVSKEKLFEQSDVISNHLPDIPSTQNILDYSLFSKMKKNAVFINTGRGRQVVEKDLIKALRKEKGRCAVLDVARHEPPFPFSPFYYMKNVFLSPHIAGSINQEERRMAEYMLDAYESFNNGHKCIHEVSLEMLDKMT